MKKLRGGLYYYPKQSAFGEVPADDYNLVRAFLKDDRFLLTSPNAYNTLGLGTTQLYNKRIGRYELALPDALVGSQCNMVFSWPIKLLTKNNCHIKGKNTDNE